MIIVGQSHLIIVIIITIMIIVGHRIIVIIIMIMIIVRHLIIVIIIIFEGVTGNVHKRRLTDTGVEQT